MNAGVIGMGIIGSRIAQNYAAAGHRVAVWNRTPRQMPGFAASPAAVAEQSDAIQFFVRDGAALLEVVAAMQPALGSRHVIINSATVSLADTLAAAALAAQSGAAFLDCPFTGSRDAAGGGQLVYYIGGDAAVLDRMRPLLSSAAKDIIPVGKIGDATIIKIATNMVSAATVEILAEAMAVAAASGVPLEKFQQAMEANASCSGLARMKMPGIIQGKFEPHFSLKNMLKDSRFALELAGQAGVDIPVLRATSRCMDDLNASGHGESDYSVLASRFPHGKS